MSMERLLPRTALLSLYHELAGGSQPSALQELGPSRPPCCLAGRQAWRLPRPSPALSGLRASRSLSTVQPLPCCQALTPSHEEVTSLLIIVSCW